MIVFALQFAYVVLAYLFFAPGSSFGVFGTLFWILAMGAWVHSVDFVYKVGAADFCRLWHPSDQSPYAVGTRDTKLTDKQLEATVFYPVDKASVADKPYTALWYSNADRTIESFSKSIASMVDLPMPIPNFLLRSYTNVKIPAYVNAELSSRFKTGKEAIRPIVFSHGLSADKNFYTAVCLALAAHGHLVISFNHQDRSCFHTYDKEGKDMFYESHPLSTAPIRKA